MFIKSKFKIEIINTLFISTGKSIKCCFFNNQVLGNTQFIYFLLFYFILNPLSYLFETGTTKFRGKYLKNTKENI